MMTPVKAKAATRRVTRNPIWTEKALVEEEELDDEEDLELQALPP